MIRTNFQLPTSRFALLLFLTACASQPHDVPMHASSGGQATSAGQPCAAWAAPLNAVLWMQTSAEYQAIMRETYRTARTQLDLALADPAWNALPDITLAPSKPPAVILDLDETAIDTSAQTARQILAHETYSDEAWMRFSMAGNARAIAPALDFFQYAASKGVTVFYVTNRKKEEEPPLRRNLIALGFPMTDTTDTVLTRGERPEWTGDKTSRRTFVAANYRVLELFGDDLNDFVAAAGKSLAERNDLMRRYDEQWGRRWFALPNPVYGSWERAVVAGASGPCGEFQKKLDTLRTDEDYKP
jgi:5'-nucleotidase (lipoprotein e(P4) family)